MSGGADPRDRRAFLGKAAVAGGGLWLALTLPACGRRRAADAPPVAAGAAAAEGNAPAQLNAWLRIAPDDSITVIVDRSEMGQGVYTALPMLLAEELAVDLAQVRIEAAPVGDAYVNPGNGGQITGTSNSVQDAWEKLRMAGARARMLLIAAAAQRWRVEADTCRAERGRVFDAQGRSAPYGALCQLAATLPMPAVVKLKAAQDFRLIGRPQPRLDTPEKVDGSARFGIDVRLPGMLYAAMAQSPVLGGRPAAVDFSAAQRLPGVRRVLQASGGVVVIADHFHQALMARNALRITWDPGPNQHLDDAAIGALLARAEKADAGLVARAVGDTAAALRAGGHTRSAVYQVPLLAHATMEPMNCTADVTATGCDLYVGTQVQRVAQQVAARAAGLPEERVRVHTTLLGGGFGRRLDVDFIPAAVEASKAMGAPVQLLWTREDDMTHDTYRPPARLALSAAQGDDGRPHAFAMHIVSPSVTARMFPPVKGVDDGVVEYAINFPYAVPNTRLTYTRQEIGIDCGYLRSVSHAPNCFAIECFMDELAIGAGQDPLAFRLGLLEHKPRHAEVLRAAASRAGWGHAPPGHFLGIALMEGYSTHIAQVAEISVDGGRLKVHRITCVVDCGQQVNPRIVESQIEGGIVFGLTAALWGEINLRGGVVRQRNFDGYRVLRFNELPVLDIKVLDSRETPGGIGEAAVPLVAPALCNAIQAATGKRLRTLPLAAAKWLAV